MKKVILGLIILFIGGQLLTSCSSESQVLSQFSKRKYLKKYKKKKVKFEDNIDEYTAEYETEEVGGSVELENFVMNEIEVVDNAGLIIEESAMNTEVYEEENVVEKPYSDWSGYSKEIDWSILDRENVDVKDDDVMGFNNQSANQVDDVVLIILGIFIPPLAVYLYEDSITNNFWIDLILTLFFWLPGIIFAFLVIFGGVSI